MNEMCPCLALFLKSILPWSGESFYRRAPASLKAVAQPFPSSAPQKGHLCCSLCPLACVTPTGLGGFPPGQNPSFQED